jgi:hypothetical protein
VLGVGLLQLGGKLRCAIHAAASPLQRFGSDRARPNALSARGLGSGRSERQRIEQAMPLSFSFSAKSSST